MQTSGKSLLLTGLVGVLALAGIVALGVYCCMRHEPSYGGRSLSSWLQDMDGYAGKKMQLAQEAVRTMDTNAVPCLIRVLRERDSPLKQRVRDVLRGVFPGRKLSTPLERHRQAVYACAALGPRGRAAIPGLSRLLCRQENETLTDSIAYTLAGMGPDAVPFLTNALASTNARVRASVAGVLWRTGNSSLATPLANCLEDADSNVRTAAIGSFPQLETNAQRVVRVLVQALRDPDERVQSAAAYRLQEVGVFWQNPEAKAAVPLLLRAVKSSDPDLSHWAAAALAKIDPQANQSRK
jgi:HEAT repeat protein